MKIKQTLIAMVMLSGLGAVCAQADVYTPKNAGHRALPPVQSAEDAVSQIPILAKIPHSFIVGDGFRFKLSGKELRIDHMADHSRAPVARRNCLISLNIASPVAFFGTSMELPIFNTESLISGWSNSSLGDYVMHFSKDATVNSPTFGLKVSARF
jgi:hypothetical protein